MSKENYPISQVKALIELCEGRAVARVRFKKNNLIQVMEDSGLVVVSKDGKSYLYTAINIKKMEAFVKRILNVEDPAAYLEILEKKAAGGDLTRSDVSKATNDSKRLGEEVMKGFKVNVIEAQDVVYGGEKIILQAARGMCIEIQDWKKLSLPDDVTVVGVENYETFMYIKDYAHLFDAGGRMIFIFRDTLTPGAYGRVREFLLEVPNRYVHFGDLDLGGVCIYLNEFRKVLGDRASMLVPEGYEELLRHGDQKLYQHELRPDVSLDERVAPLVDMIIRCKTGVEQEKLAWRAL